MSDSGTLAVTILAIVSGLLLFGYGILLFNDLRGEPEYDVQFVTPFNYNARGDDLRNLNDERVTLQNQGEETVDMTGWTLRNHLRVTYTFPEGFALAPGAVVTVHSGCGDDSGSDLFWCSRREIWDNNKGSATLVSGDGNKVDVHHYERLCETCGSQGKSS
ncbi:MAG: lamin tail domain-containing protein [Candidatus Bipolaricaulota bacterium]|nr:MAG: lamin tail domain-containing protein [Candidatus Bipolaricaulota bacterium]